nr:CBO0543 family protein [Desulforamulus aquiferis]
MNLWIFGNDCIVIFDAIGVEFDLWDYKYQLVPLFDIFITYDMSIMPVIYMAIYQKFDKWKSFIIANTIVAAIFAFISEPLLVWLDFYLLLKWKYIYSFPIYIAIAIVLKWVMVCLKKYSLKP